MRTAGLIGREGGDDLPDLVIDHEIDSGSSWQLPVALLDYMRRDGRKTTTRLPTATAAVFATGALTADGRIEPNDYALDLKWRNWWGTEGSRIPTLCLLPPSPKRDALVNELRASSIPGLRVEPVDDLATALRAIRDWSSRFETLAPAEREPTTEPRRARPTLTILGILVTAVAAAFLVGEASNGWSGRSVVAPETDVASTSPPAVRLDQPDGVTPVKGAPPPAPTITSIDVHVAALETRDASPCPSVELDTEILLVTSLSIDADLIVRVPMDRPLCGVEIALMAGLTVHFDVTPDLTRKALLTRLSDGRLRLRPHAGTSLMDLSIDLSGPKPGHHRRIRFAPD